MFFKRLAALLSVGVLVGLLSVGSFSVSDVAAQAKKTDTKKEDKKDPKATADDSWPDVKGTIGKITKVDEAKKTVNVSIDGKVQTFDVGDDVKFIGPRGGEGDGFKDDRFVAGRKVKLVLSGKKLKEIHLDYRPDSDKKDPKKDKK
jgi:hypothetical protein